MRNKAEIKNAGKLENKVLIKECDGPLATLNHKTPGDFVSVFIYPRLTPLLDCNQGRSNGLEATHGNIPSNLDMGNSNRCVGKSASKAKASLW